MPARLTLKHSFAFHTQQCEKKKRLSCIWKFLQNYATVVSEEKCLSVLPSLACSQATNSFFLVL